MPLLIPIYVSGLALAMLALSLPCSAAETIEEITITGNQEDVNLQMAIDHAEDNFHSILNELLEEEFRVSCSNETVLGSRIKKRICQTGYQKDELTTAAMYNYYGIPYDATAVLKGKNAELGRKTRELLETNAELRNAASRLSGLVSEYKDKYTAPD